MTGASPWQSFYVFNNVTLKAINGSLTRLSLLSLLTDWIDIMLSNRIINSSIGVCSIRKSVTRGTPQEEVLSLLLGLLVINHIIKDLEHGGIKVVAYAEDVVLLIAVAIVSDLMQKLSRWARCKRLGVNLSKTELVLLQGSGKSQIFRYLCWMELG